MIWPSLFFGLLALAALWSLRSPGIAIGLLICMYGIESFLQTRSNYFINNSTYVNIAIGAVVLIAAGASLLRLPYRPRQIDTVQILTLSLFGLGFLSYFWTIAPQEFHRWRGCIPYLGVFTVLAPILTREENALTSGFKWAMIIGVPIMVATAFFTEWGTRGMMLARPVLEDNQLVTETRPLAMATLASALGIIGLVTHLRIPGAMLFRLAILGIAIYIAFLTRSRGQVVAIIGVAAIVYPISNRAANLKGLMVTMIGIVIFAVIVSYIISNLELIRWGQDRVERAMIGRSEMWGDLLSYWWWHPGKATFLGFGVCSSFEIIGFYPHNLPVEILAELGLLGFSIYAGILLMSLRNSLTLLSVLEDFPKMRGDVVAVIGLIGVSFALSLKQGSLYIWPPFFFYTICLSQQVQLAVKATMSSKKKNWGRHLFIRH